ncbi:LUC7 amine-terminal protein [Gregarina niphandrodes]|uniref:LUC7 amine-terminal protein n=1 Tax=Gregarina niphandrodes TaxID=110365 RepID=A0A023B4H7_GRENI|nr:LUC7 amine-terminal protein [Gregarina niphandrodes]EZG56758.1 LUC7 amine-terminal protein [Gregarina niphandrodes]|eukprot:XP_011131167.1 LUC7 amine-terminal protein [Gregarina niphandrodes]
MALRLQVIGAIKCYTLLSVAALLDSLLGADRNELPSAAGVKRRSFADPDVCKYYLVDFCPHDLFPNTRSHLGPCPRVHDEAMKEEYKRSADKERYAVEFEEEMLAFLKQLVSSAEQKIQKANRRIDAPLPENALLSDEQQQLINAMNDKITNLLKDAEIAGEKGDVEEVASITRQVQTLKREIERAGSLVYGSYMQREKSLRVCSICGAMQSVGDSMSRFESHVTGKLHLLHGGLAPAEGGAGGVPTITADEQQRRIATVSRREPEAALRRAAAGIVPGAVGNANVSLAEMGGTSMAARITAGVSAQMTTPGAGTLTAKDAATKGETAKGETAPDGRAPDGA